MPRRLSCGLIAAGFLILLAPAPAAGVQALFDLTAPSGGPFPSDRFTVPDDSQNTGLRVNLPKPDCAARVSDCEDIEVLNELDGFNLQPRLSVPFSGPIDVDTVTSETVFLVSLGSALPGGPPPGRQVGINQVVWDVATNTLHVESDELLDQHTRYVLIVTRGVRDAAGDPVEAAGRFQSFRHGQKVGQRDDDPAVTAYREALLAGLEAAAGVVDLNHVATASVFTTMSVTAVLEKIRAQIRAADPPAPADFLLGLGPPGPDGKPTRTARTVFPLSAITGMTVNEQVSTAPAFAPSSPRLAQLRIVPGAVGTVAFGSYRSPVYLNAGRFIPQVGTRTGTPVVQGDDEVFFDLFLPAATAARPRPVAGWPVAIYVSGCCAADNKNGTPFNIAATLANRGIATLAINAAGQGRGPLGTFTVRLAGGGAVTFPAGGRSLDVDGDGTIGPGEGIDAPSPRSLLLGRDARRQTVADLMQLVRVIEAGVDADGDGAADLDLSRIYYAGFSAGAMAGTPFVAVEPGVRAAVLNVPGGLLGERLRLSPGGNRLELAELLASRVPSLLNAPGVAAFITTDDLGEILGEVPVAAPHFNENLPLRDGVEFLVRLADETSHNIQSPEANAVPGAMEIQEVLEHMEWAYMPADPVAFAPYLRKTPLAGAAERPAIVQFANGDQTVPNPATTAILRAGDLADRATYYRTDLAVDSYGAGPAGPPPTPPPGVETNGHNFLVRLNSPTRTAIALAAQEQAAVFFASDGATVIDPNDALVLTPAPPEPLFESPIVPPLPEDLGFIP
jgi:hypothetical protein